MVAGLGALALFLLAISLPGGAATAAPVVNAPFPGESACIALPAFAPRNCSLEAITAADQGFRIADLDLIGRGGDLLGGAAVSALQMTGAVTPIPLPAAVWLLAMGLGGLGLMGRRRREALPALRGGDGLAPAAADLRTSARTEVADPRRVPVRLDGFRRLIDAFRLSCLNAARAGAFARGQISPHRPNGGAGTLWAATARRGPPADDACERLGGALPAPAGVAAVSGSAFMARLHGWMTSLAARLFCAPDALLPGPARVPVRVAAFRAGDTKNGSNPHHRHGKRFPGGGCAVPELQKMGVRELHK